MGFIPTDILVKTCIEAGINDLRKNQWILYDILSWLSDDILAQAEYGQKEIQAFIDFFNTNKLPVYLDFRVDSPEFPCITVASLPRVQSPPHHLLGDGDEVCEEVFSDELAGQKFIHKNLTIKAYDKAKGIITLSSPHTTDKIGPNQLVLAHKSNKVYPILSVLSQTQFQIAPNIIDDFQHISILPPTSAWNVHRETITINEEVVIGIHAQGNPVHAQWLHDIVWYVLLRCKEVYLEGRGFQLSTLQSDALYLNPNYSEADRIFSRNIHLRGLMHRSYIKFRASKLSHVGPARIWIDDSLATPEGMKKIIDDHAWAPIGDKPKNKK